MEYFIVFQILNKVLFCQSSLFGSRSIIHERKEEKKKKSVAHNLKLNNSTLQIQASFRTFELTRLEG